MQNFYIVSNPISFPPPSPQLHYMEENEVA